MKRFVVAFTAAVILLALQGCAGPTVLRAEIPILGPDISATPSVQGESKVLFFNNSNKLLFGIDNTGKVGIYVDGKGLGVLQIGQYVQISLPRGPHRIELVHVDIVEFRSSHSLEVGSEAAYVEVFATPVSNDLNVFSSLPEGNYLPKPFEPYVRR